jgi:hypothetical protein
MKNGLFTHGKGMQLLCFFAVVSLLLLSCGCTQQSSGSPAAAPPAETAIVTVTQPDSAHILITYPGSPRTDTLVELEISVTDSTGKVTTQSMGSRMATTPIRYGGTQSISGSFNGKDRVYITGYFSDGSQKPVIDTTI